MRYYLSIAFLTLYLVQAVLIRAQFSSNITVEKITINDGLSQGLVTDIVQDRQGFLWFCTHDGLNKYDGHQFTVYLQDQEDSTSLSGNELAKMFEDSHGYIWVVNHKGGIDRFCPATEQVTRFYHRPGDKHSLSSNNISHLFEDSRRYIWLTTANGLNLYDPYNDKFHRFFVSEQNPRRLAAIVEDTLGDGSIYIHDPNESALINLRFSDALLEDMGNEEAIPQMDVRVHRESSIQIISYPKTFPKPLIDLPPIFIDEDRYLYAIGLYALYGIDLRNSEKFIEKFDYPQSKRLDNYNRRKHAYYNDAPRKKLWVGGSPDLYCFNKQDKTFDKYVISKEKTKDQILMYILPDSTGNLLLLKRDSILFFDPDSKEHQQITSYGLQQGIFPTNMLRSHSGIIWLGTNGGGLVKFDPYCKPFEFYGKNGRVRNEANKQYITQVYQDNQENLWVNVVGKWMHVDRSTGKQTPFKDFFSIGDESGSIYSTNYSIAQTSDQHYLIFGSKKMWQYNPTTKTFKNLVLRHSENKRLAGCLFENEDERVWFFANKKPFISEWNTSKQTFIPLEVSSEFMTQGNWPITKTIIEEGNYFYASSKKGLYHLNTETQYFKHFKHDPDDPQSIGHDFVMDMIRDPLSPEGYIWLGTGGGGLNRLDKKTGKFKRYTTKDGLPNNVIYSVLSDKEGHLWLSTNKGLSRFDPQTETFRNYTYTDGLQGNEFNTNVRFQGPSGEMFFGGTEGLTAFYPDKIQDNTYLPPIHITDFRLDNRSVSHKDSASVLSQRINFTNHITLSHDQNMISFSFAALDYVSPEKNLYSYKLEGLDEKWSPPSTFRQTTYTNLDPGDYNFMVKGSNSDGIWNESPASISLTILYPWWATWWAYLFYFIVGISITCITTIFLVRHAQKKREARQLKELDQVKTKFFSNITHEFRTPLTLVIGPLEQIMTESLSVATVRRKLKGVLKNARNLLDLINQLLDLSKLENQHMKIEISRGDIIDYTKELINQFQPWADSKNLKLDFIFQPDHWKTHFDKRKWHKIVHNLISNAIKFTPNGGSITANLERLQQSGQEYIQLQVKDTGIGIAKENQKHIFDRFYQTDASSTRVQGGTGIGLSLVKELAELQNGSVTVISAVSEGTTFTVKLPVNIPTGTEKITQQPFTPSIPVAKEEMLANPETNLPANGEKEKLKLLIIEDNAEMRAYIRSCISSPQYDISEARDGEEGIQKALDIVPDLIISDVMMPKKDGFKVTQAIRNHIATSHIPLILLTARASLESRLEGISHGADIYLTKPFSPKELTLRIHKLIEFRKFLQARYQKDKISESHAELQKEDKFITELKHYITQHISETNLSGDSISQHFAMSRMQLYRKIKTLTDNTLGYHIRDIRMNTAIHLLEERKLNIAQIAYQTGFSSPAHFSNTFKKQYGKAPSDFREIKVKS